MKNIFRIGLSLALVLVFSACGEEPFDLGDPSDGELGANLTPQSTATYLGGISTGVEIDLNPFANEGVTISSINVTKTLETSMGDSDPVTYEISGETFEQTTAELFADVPVGGVVQSNSTLTPGDTWTLSYTLSLSDGRTMTISTETVITFLCAPYPGVWTIEMHDSFGDGWQTDDGNGGSGLQVTLSLADGSTSELEIGMCSPYGAAANTFLGGSDCVGPAATSGWTDATAQITIPDGTENAQWLWPGDRYGEISFEIYGPDGSLVYSYVGSSNAPQEILSVILCAP